MKPNNTLFALFFGVLLGICIAEIYLASSHVNIITASSPSTLEKVLMTSLQTSHSDDDDDVHAPTDDANRNANVQTVAASTMANSASHHVNIAQEHHLETDNSNSIHRSTTFNCSNQSTLPMTQQSPKECWPHLTILPSHATSGSKLFQDIWELFGTSMSQYNEPPHKIDLMYSFDNVLDIYGSVNETMLPYHEQQPVVIFKSHISQSKKLPRREEMKEMLHRIKEMGLLRGIIRMARNPGDQLIRNSFRWSKHHEYCKSHDKSSRYTSEFDCFLDRAKQICKKFSRTGGGEINLDRIAGFHQYIHGV